MFCREGDHVACLGCRLANGLEPVHVVYEDEAVCCILDHEPFNEGHVMVLPKGHVEDVDELDKETANRVMEAAGLVAKALKRLYEPDGITICQNGGIFSELTHFHMHVVPRYRDQRFADFYSDVPLDNDVEKGRLAETAKELAGVIGRGESDEERQWECSSL
ncbi:HIT family protein [Bacillus sp. H-16]|uniref:HIT family protein n=1 Tax=Alteribacter salitolerans TaxID=2912333 RepID=UPI00196235E9|nr:HIT family protein [Alteribacter salitolerans]MBM7095098.1 HIT family protein [Alteribacter salitolerans]